MQRIEKPWRGIVPATFEFYNVKQKVDFSGKPIAVTFPYPNGRTKVRFIDRKEFISEGEKNRDTGNLFGMDRFPASKDSRTITVTEGELDALSVFQIMGSKYAAVSVGSASSAKSDISKDYEYVNSFDKIYLAFDNDEPGRKASAEVARLFDFNKVYIVKLDQFKDANEYLVNDKGKDFYNAWWNAKRFLPEGILSSFSEIDQIIDEDVNKPSIPYPFENLQDMTYGIRSGEYILLKAMEGVGKTEVFRAFEYHLLKTTDSNIGIIHLEESKPRIIKGLVGYELERPVHLPDMSVSKEELKKTYRGVVKRDERVHIYSHFGSDDPDIILNTIRFMAGPCNCKYVFLDHITLVVSGLAGEDERKALDYISSRLKMMAEELDFTIFLISHVNDEGQTRGSRNISKVADLVVYLDRDLLNPDQEVRNQTKLIVEKNRFAGKTGLSSTLQFNPSTFKLSEVLELPI